VIDYQKFIVAGPQCDMGQSYWGSLYGERFGGMMKQSPPDLVKRAVKPSDFNDYYIKCVGKHVTIKINGETMVDGDFAALPDEGIIAWQLHAGPPMKVTFKDIQFTDLSKPRAEAPPAPHSAEEKGFAPLFNGKDLTGWKTHPRQPGNWRVENGVLIGSSNGVSHLYTQREDYTDFHLRMESRINDGGNSGVYFRAPFGPSIRINAKQGSGPPTWVRGYNAKLAMYRFGSLLIDDLPLIHDGEIPATPGRWVTFEVIAEGNHLTVKINGSVTAEFIDEKRRYVKGHIVLQQHGARTVVEFRKIEIKELK
jgi:hypothetical protein